MIRRTKSGGSPRIVQIEEPAPATRTASPAPTSMAISLLPFAQKLQEKYGLFTISNSNNVDWRSSEYVEQGLKPLIGNTAAP